VIGRHFLVGGNFIEANARVVGPVTECVSYGCHLIDSYTTSWTCSWWRPPYNHIYFILTCDKTRIMQPVTSIPTRQCMGHAFRAPSPSFYNLSWTFTPHET